MGKGQAPGIEETDGELTAAPTPEQPERGVHFVTTAPTLKPALDGTYCHQKD